MERDKKSNKTTIRWLIKITGKSSLGIGLLAFCRGMAVISELISVFAIKNVIDKAVAGNRNDFITGIFICGGIFLFMDGLYAYIYRLQEKIHFKVENKLRKYVYHRLLHTECGSLQKWHTGDLMNRLNGDVEIIASNMTSIIPHLLAMLIRLGGSAVILAAWDWRFCAMLLVCGVFAIPVTIPARKWIKRLNREVRGSYDSVQSFLQETIENVILIRSFFMENRSEKILDEHMKQVRNTRFRRNAFSNLFYTGFACITDLGYLAGLLWGGIGIVEGRVSFGTLSAVLQLVGKVQQPLGDITSFLPQYYALCASAERLREIEELPSEVSENPSFDGKEYYKKFTEIQIRDLGFSYEKTQVLDHASLTIKKGDFVACTGASGIGKSTLVKLLLALYKPDYGEIKFCDTEDRNLLVSPDTRVLFAYVPQGNFLMSGSIYETVEFLHETGDFTEEEKERVQRACRIACADEFIREMPEKYETIIGERGIGLSEGQVQRLAIARAIYSDAPILLLDEATSALDEATEELVLKNIRNMHEKTVLIVTHRNKALSICNRIVEISKMQFIEDDKDAGLH